MIGRMAAALTAAGAGGLIVAGVVRDRLEWVAIGALSVTVAAMVVAVATIDRGRND